MGLRGRPLAIDLDRVREIAANGDTQATAAKTLGVSRQWIRQLAKTHDIEFSPPSHQHRRQRMASECVGMTARQAADHLGISLALAYSDAKSIQGFEFAPAPVGRPLGETAIRIDAELPALAEQGMTQSEAARTLDVWPSAVERSRKRTGVEMGHGK